MLSKRLKGIGFSLKSHFKSEHSREPYPDPLKIKMEDFKSHSVELYNWFSNGYYTFNSKIFYSYDYCIAVITHSDFDLYEGDPPSDLFAYFVDYFPESAIREDRRMLNIKDLNDVTNLSNKDLKDLVSHVLIELKKRRLLEIATKILSQLTSRIE